MLLRPIAIRDEAVSSTYAARSKSNLLSKDLTKKISCHMVKTWGWGCGAATGAVGAATGSGAANVAATVATVAQLQLQPAAAVAVSGCM